MESRIFIYCILKYVKIRFLFPLPVYYAFAASPLKKNVVLAVLPVAMRKQRLLVGTSGVATGKPANKLTMEAPFVLGQLPESRGVKIIFTRTTIEVSNLISLSVFMLVDQQIEMFLVYRFSLRFITKKKVS
jgi:hypothetical protein